MTSVSTDGNISDLGIGNNSMIMLLQRLMQFELQSHNSNIKCAHSTDDLYCTFVGDQ